MVFKQAAVASPHFLATEAGVEVLEQGGNAVDAVIATNLVLAVVCPHLCGAGGDLIGIVWADGGAHGLNSTGKLPAGAELPEDGKVPQHGIGSVTVPGAAAGWVALAEKFGTVPLAELAKPAIKLCREGFEPTPSLQRGLERSRELLSSDAEARRIFLGGGKITNPELADILEDLEAYYSGPVAKNAPLPFTPDDFASHEAEWVDPLRTTWEGLEVLEMPPNSRGHLVLKALDRMESLHELNDSDAEFHLRMIRAIGSATLEGDTVYLCAWDSSGMVVSINESNYMGWGSGVVVPGTGVHLHNRGAYFTPETYKGGNKPIHTLSPAMALEDGEPKMAFGTMGGEAQVQIHMQLLARAHLLGYGAQEAVAAPRWVKHGREGNLLAEEGLPDLEGATRIPLSDIAGHAHMIIRTAEGLDAGADPRADSLAAGF